MLPKTEVSLPRFGLISLLCLVLGLIWYWLQPAVPQVPESCARLDAQLKSQGAYFLNWQQGVLVLVRPQGDKRMLQAEAADQAAACAQMLTLIAE